MKFKFYLKDKVLEVVVFLVSYVLILLFLLAFKVQISLILVLSFIYFLTYVFLFLFSFFRKKSFYDEMLSNVRLLDKAYLVLETINKPNFYEGKIIMDVLYDINKSYLENINNLERQVNDFKDYIEMWIHEVKIPLSSLTLSTHNHKDRFTLGCVREIKRIDDYLEQILYYVRSENANKDYLINKVSLKKCINSVALRNKDFLLESKIDLSVSNIDYDVYTDSKWLEFIINQIVSNSIKYRSNKRDSFIRIYGVKNEDFITLVIEDNGIGISDSDIGRVFDKSFTGSNGRSGAKSTGMGLFIAKNLCNKLGHQIDIESVKDEYTKVYISISTNKFYDVVS